MPRTSTSTSKSSSPLETALNNVPSQFRSKVVKCFLDVKRRLAEGNDESLGVAAGKLCEVVLRLLQYEILKSHIPFGQKIPDFPSECRKLIESPKTAGVESLRIVMPRAKERLGDMDFWRSSSRRRWPSYREAEELTLALAAKGSITADAPSRPLTVPSASPTRTLGEHR